MEQEATLEQWEASLSIGTAFDPLQFVGEPLHHPVALCFGTGVGDGLCIIRQAIDKADQLLDSRGTHSHFPLVQPALAFPLAQQLAKVLCQPIDDGDRRINLTYLLNKGLLVLCLRLLSPDEGERSRSRGKDFGQGHRLSGDGCSRLRAKLVQHSLQGALRASISLCHDLLIQLSRCLTSLIPPASQIGDVRIDQVAGMVPSQAARGLDLTQGYGTHCDC
jgi:hypothetical protein